MKKLIAVVLCLLIACTAFACLVAAANEPAAEDPYETDIPQVITNIAGGNSADHREDLRNGFKFFRIVTENLSRLTKDLAFWFDNLVERLRAFSVTGLFSDLFNKIKP